MLFRSQGSGILADKVVAEEMVSQEMAAPTLGLPAPSAPPPASQTAPALAEPPTSLPAPASEAKPEVRPGKGHAKIAPSLQNLSEKLVDGNYAQGEVRVKDGWVEVFIYLTDDSQERLTALRNLGVQIVSHASSGKMVHARVRVADLEKVAELDFVGRITPSTF